MIKFWYQSGTFGFDVLAERHFILYAKFASLKIWIHSGYTQCKSNYLVFVFTVKYLSSPPSSIMNEGLFSICEIVYTDQRSSLLPENEKFMMFLNNSLRKLNYG